METSIPLAEQFSYSGTELDAMDLATNYHRWILAAFEPYLQPRVIEVGAGIGTFSFNLLENPRVRELTALEPAENLFPILESRLRDVRSARPLQSWLQNLDLQDATDSLVAVNVMEHIEDDAAFLRTARRALVPGGTILLFVPALPWIYGVTDKEFGHFRRYLKPELKSKLSHAGFRVEVLRYMNFPGIVSWLINSRILRRHSIPASNVRFYDGMVVPIVRRIEDIVTPPLGQSLIAVARK